MRYKKVKKSVLILITLILIQFGWLLGCVSPGSGNPIEVKSYNIHGPSFINNNSVYLKSANVEINCSNGKAECKGVYILENVDNLTHSILVEFKNDFVTLAIKIQYVSQMLVDSIPIEFSEFQTNISLAPRQTIELVIFWEYEYVFEDVTEKSFLFYSKNKYLLTGYVINGGNHWNKSIEEESVVFNLFDNEFLNKQEHLNVHISNFQPIETINHDIPTRVLNTDHLIPNVEMLIVNSTEIAPEYMNGYFKYQFSKQNIMKDYYIQIMQKSHVLVLSVESRWIVCLSLLLIGIVSIVKRKSIKDFFYHRKIST